MDQTMVPEAYDFAAEGRRAVLVMDDSDFTLPPDLQGRETALLLTLRTAERIGRRIEEVPGPLLRRPRPQARCVPEREAAPAAPFGALLLEAHWARMPFGDKLRIAGLAAGDVAIGWMPLVAEVLHGRQTVAARRVAAHAARHLELIRDARRHLARSGETVREDDPVLTGLREALFGPRKRRGGDSWRLARAGRDGSVNAIPGGAGTISARNVPAEGDRHAVA